jgi:hypothetical protein
MDGKAEGPSAAGKSSMVATFRAWPRWERGLLAFDREGISYIPLARSGANIFGAALIAVWFVFGAIVAANGGFIGLLPNLVVVTVIYVLMLGVSSGMHKRARDQESLAAANGLSAINPLEGGCTLRWNDVTSVSLPSGRRSKFKAVSGNTPMPTLQLLVKGSALAYRDREAVARAVRDAVGKYAPRLLSETPA